MDIDALRRRRAAAVAALTSAVEWYDYFVFGIAAALILGKLFFPPGSEVAAVLAGFATFAVGFLARPLGGIIAGHLGDKYGRKPMLVLALLTMGIATTGIGLLPTYDTIGVLAPVLLVILRVFQGLAVGAQWGGAMLMATENAPEGKRGIFGSLVQLGVPIGVITANAAFLLAGAVTNEPDFARWGWRMPFLVGLFVIALAGYVHVRIDETPEYSETAAADEPRKMPLGVVLRTQLGTVLLAGGSFAVNPATFYVITTGLVDYATRVLGMTRSSVLLVMLAVSATQIILVPAAAALSDRFGRLRVYAVGAAALFLWLAPMFLLVDTGSLLWYVVATFVASCCLSTMYGPQAALFAELFRTEVRYTGASVGYQISSVLGGGLAPFLMVLLLDATGTSLSVAGYLMLLGVVALVSIWLLGARARARTRSAAVTTD